jgi:hypothetical protein
MFHLKFDLLLENLDGILEHDEALTILGDVDARDDVSASVVNTFGSSTGVPY